jgi:hypothetical protein
MEATRRAVYLHTGFEGLGDVLCFVAAARDFARVH